jgi:dTDP-4-dehydrorhamnose reductase
MKALVLGCNGQLGLVLADTAPADVKIVGLGRTDLDITNADAVLECCRETSPNVIINAAAYTAVDQAESEPALARAVNADGPRNITVASRDIGARLIHISTDFVFDGKSSTPYATDAETNPLNVYGVTKRDGELAALEETSGSATVIRTSWLYSKYGNNFVKTMLRLMEERDELRVVADQFGSPTWCSSLARAVWAFAVAPEQYGVFHWSDSGETTWHEFAVAIQEEALSLGLLKKAIPVRAIKTSEYPAAASRPRYTVLDCASSHAAINVQPEPWRQNLRRMLRQMAE